MKIMKRVDWELFSLSFRNSLFAIELVRPNSYSGLVLHCYCKFSDNSLFEMASKCHTAFIVRNRIQLYAMLMSMLSLNSKRTFLHNMLWDEPSPENQLCQFSVPRVFYKCNGSVMWIVRRDSLTSCNRAHWSLYRRTMLCMP